MSLGDAPREELTSLALPSRMRLVEVGLRDGLQTVTKFIPTADKVAIARDLVESGVTEIEAVSFAHPKVLPQFADAVEVMANVPRLPGVKYRGLVPYVRGAERAAACGLDITVALATTDEAVTQKNQNSSVAEVLAGLGPIGEIVRSSGSEYVVGIANSFFAWGSGQISQSQRMRAVDAAVSAGATGVYLACTTGMEDPRQVFEGVREVRDKYPDVEVGVHLHARNGMALATALAAMQAGAHWLEGAFGGLGGDMWAPGRREVLGNAPFEDLVHMMGAMGIETGIDLERYLEVVREVAVMTEWSPLSAVINGGTREELVCDRIFEASED